MFARPLGCSSGAHSLQVSARHAPLPTFWVTDEYGAIGDTMRWWQPLREAATEPLRATGGGTLRG
jgi:hypothetical protein